MGKAKALASLFGVSASSRCFFSSKTNDIAFLFAVDVSGGCYGTVIEGGIDILTKTDSDTDGSRGSVGVVMGVCSVWSDDVARVAALLAEDEWNGNTRHGMYAAAAHAA